MPPARHSVIADQPCDLRVSATVVQVADVAFGRQADHYAQAVTLRLIEQPPRRRRVRAHGVHMAGRHYLEVAGNELARRELMTVGI